MASNTAPKVNFQVFHNVINGKLTTTPVTRNGLNPATGEKNPNVPMSTADDLDQAVAAATAAQKPWARLSWAERAAKIRAFADLVSEYRDELVNLLISEQGKAYVLAQDEFDRVLKNLYLQIQLSLPEEKTQGTENFDAVVRYVPIGVACALVPWNYPMMVAIGKMVPALLAGNALIIKPSPDTPYCNLKLVELSLNIFPPGVLQCLSGDHDLGPMFTAHPGIDKVSFTGSVRTGKLVMESCAKTLKRVVLELGGNDAAIICEDVDIDAVVPAIAQLGFLNSGQVCMVIKRVYVHTAIYDRFASALVEFTRGFKVGPATDHDNFIGPLQNRIQYDKVMRYMEDVESGKQHALLRGNGTAVATKPSGYFISPTIIDNPPDSASITQEEQFGPVLPLLRWEGSDVSIIARANNSSMGLGASVWSKDVARAERMARQLQAGSVWVNTHMEVSPLVPFGGHKSSGIGQEWGVNGLKGWCNSQTVWTPRGAPAVAPQMQEVEDTNINPEDKYNVGFF